MARLPVEQIERLKRDVDLLRLVESQGYTPVKTGKDFVISCPFHEDKTPSLVISPQTNLFHCFGCGAAGSVIDWVMKTQGLSFRLACELLQNDIGAVAVPVDRVRKRSSTHKLPSTLAADLVSADGAAAVNQVVNYYHQTLQDSPEALAYLDKRGLNDPRLMAAFKLGFANRTLAYHIPENNRATGKAIRSSLKATGILRKSGHEHFNGSIVIPIINDRGQVVEMYGRRISDGNQSKGAPKHLYLPGPHLGVLNASGLTGCDEIILCEALLDALTFWVHGFTHVTSSYGTQGFTHEMLTLLIRLGVKRVLIAYDRDGPGDAAALKVAEQLQANGIDCFRLLFPRGMDVNQWAAEAATAVEAREHLSQAIRKAEWLGNGKAPERPLLLDLPTDTTGVASLAAPPLDESDPLAASELADQPVSATGLLPKELPETLPEKLEPLPVDSPVTTTDVLPKSSAPLVKNRSGLNNTLPEELPVTPDVLPEKPPATLPATQPDLPVLPASPLPVALADNMDCEINDREILLGLGDRVYRVRGLHRNTTEGQLKINLMVTGSQGYHTDTLELYHAKQRQVFINQACVELGVKDEVIKKDVGKVLLKLESLQDEQRQTTEKAAEAHRLTPEEHQAAMALLTDKHLLNTIVDDFNQLGLIGEETNKLVGYLACVSRKLDKPLGVVIQSSSAAGKSSLMEAILQLMPEEDRVQYSAMTGQSLFYMGETNLKHKILAIAEEEGASNASYALKLLQSEGEVTIASTGKDEATGDLITKDYRVEGPTQLFMTTTAIDVDEELMNRCIVLSVDESKAQTEAIHKQQRYGESLAGVFAKATQHTLIAQHQNAQRLLKAIPVVNPYAEHLQFLSDKTRTRRDHVKYLTLIKTITLLHQYQREIKVHRQGDESLDYIEVTLADIEKANELVHQVLGKSLDELPPQTRNLLDQLHVWANAQCAANNIAQSDFRFSRRDIRELTGWSDGQLKIHCKRLEELEYLLVHRGGRGQSLVYELLYTGDPTSNDPHLMGLLDTERLQAHGYDDHRLGEKAKPSPLSQGQVRPKSGSSQGGVVSSQLTSNGVYRHLSPAIDKNAHRG